MKLTIRHWAEPIRLLACFVLLAATVVSCKKDEITNPLDLDAGKLSMKIDGTLREAESAYVLTLPDEHTGRHVVTVTSFFTPDGATDNEEVLDAFHLYLNLSAEEFKNPKGTYDVMLDGENSGFYALYQLSIGGQEATKVYGVLDPEKAIGKLPITDFKIGDGRGHSGLPNITGYAMLEGTFQVHLQEVALEDPDAVTITEGKFKVHNLPWFP